MHRERFNDYFLVNDQDMLELDDDSIEFKAVRKRHKCKKIMCGLLIVFILLVLIAFLLIFVVFPLIFMNSVSLQQQLIFTHRNLEIDKDYYQQYRFPGFKNHYIKIKDADKKSYLYLGLWHILPLKLAEIARNDSEYDYDEALLKSNYSVLLYFHGTGEDRSQSERKYQLLRYFFHIIAFDYRSYGDSSNGDLFERTVVSDCIQIYNWVKNKTNSPIYVWGHSLGTALATSTLALLENSGNATGLILEAPFTSLEEELYVHPYVKYLAWLPWFKATVINPLQKNGFIFNTSGHIQNISCPIMFLHAADDKVVPYSMSKQLYNIFMKGSADSIIKNNSVLHIFDKRLRLNHFFIYQDPYVIFFIYEFLKNTFNDEIQFYEGSHQS